MCGRRQLLNLLASRGPHRIALCEGVVRSSDARREGVGSLLMKKLYELEWSANLTRVE